MFFLDLVEWEVEVVGQDSLMDLPLNGFQDLADEAKAGEVRRGFFITPTLTPLSQLRNPVLPSSP